MAKYASKVVEQAKAWLGLKESDGSHKQIIDIYNSQKPLPVNYKLKYTDAWCAGFVSAVVVKLGYTDIIPTECGCQRMIELFKKKGIWVENDAHVPSPGDIIFYDWQDDGKGDNVGHSDHVGIVEKVANGKITVIEGNCSNSVKRRNLAVNGQYIRGYGVPKYDVENAVAAPVPTPTPVAKTIDELAQEVLDGKYGNGEERKAKLGDNYAAVQKRVNELLTGKQTKVHTVKRGESLWSISKKYLGNGGRYPEIVKLNGLKSTVIRVGQNLTIPNK